MKEDLELREQEAKFQEVYDKKTSEEKLQKEIERLRREGSQQLEVNKLIFKNKMNIESFFLYI